MSRMNHKKVSPEGFAALVNVMELVKKSGIESKLLNIVYLHVSQMNGCPYCVDMHWKDAIKDGADARALNSLTTWRDTPFFSEKERAALEWAECVTTMIDQDSMGNSFENIRKQFSEKQVADLTYGIVQMNAFNRLGIAFHLTPTA